ncbi:MAG: Nucleoside triphosphatase NudI [Microgenomates bacterium OLB23]|nr:MAG: Nucleoside triphosphatase NudI [Microgenomates bacterium OLB23]
MPKPTDPSQHNYMFSDDMKFLQKVIIFHPTQEKFLILKRAMDSYSRPGDWDFAGGNVLFGELHNESIVREVKEETGLNVTHLEPIQVVSRYNEKAAIYYLIINYRVRAAVDTITLSHEHTEYRWVTYDEFSRTTPS